MIFNHKLNKWQDRLWGPAQGLEITLHIETYLKIELKMATIALK